MYLLEFLTDNDELFLNKSIENDLSLSKQDVLQQIIKQTLSANIYPVYFGSAINGIGIKELFIGIEYYLPCQQANDEISASGSIFKIERTDNNEKIFYIDLKAGKLEVRKPINFYQSSKEGTILINEKISRIKVFEQGKLINTPTMHAGSIAQVFGLKSAKIGDTLGEPSEQSLQTTFSRPTLETNIKACNPAKQEKLFVKLKELADQDPLISLHKNSSSHSLCIKLYGEIQKEVIKERLESEYDIKVEFGKTKMICIERPLQTGHAANIMDLHNAPLEYYATLGFKIEPGEIDSGIVYRIDGHAGSLPKGYHSVVKESVFQFLETGLHGWQVTDCIITMTDSGVCPLSIAPHFRQLTPLLMKKALQQAQTVICEPFHAFELEIPLSTLNNVLVELSHVNAKIDSGNTAGDLYYIQGEILAQHVQTIQSILPGLTQGRGTIITNHTGYINN